MKSSVTADRSRAVHLLLKLAAVFLLAISLAGEASASTFGFNYWPYGYSCRALDNANWATLRPQVAADFDHMASLGGGVVRLMFWPQESGFQISGGFGGGSFTSEFYEQTANAPDIVRLAWERNLKVIIAFGNNYFDAGNGTAGHRWWMEGYTDFSLFLGDTRTWVNGFVNAIESSPWKSAILFYDYENEYYRETPYAGWYLSYLYDWSAIPAGKRGASVLQVPADVDDLKFQLQTGGGPLQGNRPLDYVDYHSYPAVNHNPNIEASYDAVKSRFPSSTVLLGEFGRATAGPADEGAQQLTVLDVMSRARAKGIPYYLNWMFWDKTPGTDPVSTAWGYDPHSPKDVLGGASSLLGLLDNPDMEVASGSRPASWDVGGSVPVTLALMSGDPATNLRYARLQTSSASGAVWLVSSMTPVAGSRRVFLDAYIRSNLRDIQMNIVQYDQFGNRTRTSWDRPLRPRAGPSTTTCSGRDRGAPFAVRHPLHHRLDFRNRGERPGLSGRGRGLGFRAALTRRALTCLRGCLESLRCTKKPG